MILLIVSVSVLTLQADMWNHKDPHIWTFFFLYDIICLLN